MHFGAMAVSVGVQVRPAYWWPAAGESKGSLLLLQVIGIMTSAELRMGKWRRWYFALALLSALFLLESLRPFL